MEEEIYPRKILSQLIKWLERKECYVIKGPRQSGKTTILKILEEELKKNGKNTVFLNFEDPEILEAFEKRPKEYVKSFLTKNEKYYFLMDEYHYVKEPGKKLKLLFDTFENIKFIVTGSSSLELSGAMAKFLVGRVFFFELFQFSFYEFLLAKDQRLAKIFEEKNNKVRDFLVEGKEFEINEDIFLKEFSNLLEEFMIFGGYPSVIKAKDAETKKMILKNIYDTYISKDVIEFLKITDSFKYRDIVKFLASISGNVLNYNQICSTCQSYYKEVKRIISILSETYIINLVQPFYKNPITEIKKLPKVYFFDTGLRNYLLNNFNPLEKRTDSGAIAENFVFLGLRDFSPEKINYWRTIAKAEVDFVITANQETIPIEVKYQPFKEPKISRGLRSFIQSYKPKRALVITKDFWDKIKINKTEVLFVPICYV